MMGQVVFQQDKLARTYDGTSHISTRQTWQDL